MPDDEFLTILRPTHHEIEKINGSRFIANAAPVADAPAATTFINTIEKHEPAATHHCWAYRLSDGRERSFDDGEPGGTAGAPILRRIVAAGLYDVVVVVTRFYGGTNLGKGGLSRAYGRAAAEALALAPTLSKPILSEWLLVHPYDLSGPVAGVITGFDAETRSSEYGEVVKIVVAVRARQAADFAKAIVDATSGIVVPQPPTTIS